MHLTRSLFIGLNALPAVHTACRVRSVKTQTTAVTIGREKATVMVICLVKRLRMSSLSGNERPEYDTKIVQLFAGTRLSPITPNLTISEPKFVASYSRFSEQGVHFVTHSRSLPPFAQQKCNRLSHPSY
jgi:hypothetical protein